MIASRVVVSCQLLAFFGYQSGVRDTEVEGQLIPAKACTIPDIHCNDCCIESLEYAESKQPSFQEYSAGRQVHSDEVEKIVI